jgi:hypothetical protein
MSTPSTEQLHIWITGASRGIGAALAIQLSEHHRVSLSARTLDALDRTAEACSSRHAVCVAACDVSSADDVQRAYHHLASVNGPVDVLIAGAGVANFASFLDLTLDDIDAHLNVNLRGTMLTTRVVLEDMIRRRRGVILALNSVATHKAFTGCTAYGASKHGVTGFLSSLREEVREHNISIVNAIIGATETEIWPHDARVQHAHRMMQVDEVARTLSSVINNTLSNTMQIEEILLRPQLGDL